MKVERIKNNSAIDILPTITYIPKGKRSGALNYKIYFGWLMWHFYVE